jgi:hypothetical protein
MSNNHKFLTFNEAREYARELGFQRLKEWHTWSKSGKRPKNIPASPSTVYPDEWKNWGDWLGYNHQFIPFNEAREYVRGLGLKKQTEWNTWSKSGKRPKNIPSSPSTVYPDEWENWGDWLGTGNKATKDYKFLTFNEAREYARGLKLNSQKEWKKWKKLGKRPNNIPSNPYRIYPDEWKGMGDWLGYNHQFLPFNKAREYARGLKLKNQKEWKKWKKLGKRPYNIPALPEAVYHDEWKGYVDWLGNEFLNFDEAREYARRLGLKNGEEWKQWSQSDKRPDNIPSNPNRSYPEEWKGLGDWLGKTPQD